MSLNNSGHLRIVSTIGDAQSDDAPVQIRAEHLALQNLHQRQRYHEKERTEAKMRGRMRMGARMTEHLRSGDWEGEGKMRHRGATLSL